MGKNKSFKRDQYYDSWMDLRVYFGSYIDFCFF